MAGYIGKAKSLAVLAEQDPSIPSQTGNSGKYLTTDGTDASWATVEALPDAIDVNASAPADSLAIDASGNVGVGTTTPKSVLDLGTGSGGVTATPSGTYSDYAISLYASTTTSQIRNVIGAGESSAVAAGIGFVDDGGGGAQGITFATGNLSSISEAGRFDASGNLHFNSGYGSAATAYGCRAWVNFNGTGTVAIRNSGNVSSITDNGTGLYVVNFTTSMPDANYCANATANPDGSSGGYGGVSNTSTGSVTANIRRGDTGTSSTDTTIVSVSVFR